MAKKTYHIDDTVTPLLVEESRKPYGLKTYISLFSSAGVGCYGFKQEGYYCIATVELLERRLNIQRINQKCAYNSGYICGDMTQDETKEKVQQEISFWKRNFGLKDIDVLIATPPCQGMSVANHKKKDELKRNSLVVESISLVKSILPKFFVFENVAAFLKSICTDIDGSDKPINDAIYSNLAGNYNIIASVVNFKDYGNPSSRTRTLVIGVRKDLREVTPLDIFPERQPEKTLRQTIGHLPPLKKMGEIDPTDIYHSFREYAPHMEAWISDIKEGQSAFDNTDAMRIPHHVIDGVIVFNAKKNGDKYTRQLWDKVPPCIHTRNDILASQNTVHPTDNRVFSIRELMLMMSVPNSFKWSAIPIQELNALPFEEKRKFLKKEDVNIRQTLGEAVPTIIFRQIAKRIRKAIRLCDTTLSEKEIEQIIERNNLSDFDCLKSYVATSTMDFPRLSKIAEIANAKREDNAAYYTRQDICYDIVDKLPDPKLFGSSIDILEPSIGVGNFLPTIIAKYRDVPKVSIDVVDIDADSIELLKLLVSKLNVPNNVEINYIVDDFLLHDFNKKYDIIVGNPPYKKITHDKALLTAYRKVATNTDTNNIFAFFIEKALRIGNVVSLIVPKSLINAPEFNKTRDIINSHAIQDIIDFGEKAFKGVKIETLNLTISTKKKRGITMVESYITNDVRFCEQSYITSNVFPYWLIYRDKAFDIIADKMTFGVFSAYRDRKITKSLTQPRGKYRVLKSRNIGNNEILDIENYDCFVDTLAGLDVSRFIGRTDCILVPNLTYNPRACRMPAGCIADGSVAILETLNPSLEISNDDISYFASDEFSEFYCVARNRGTRSLNIDNNSVFFFGIINKAYAQ
ncbi:MAG: DNA cytosine methyltransferase [Muribaculaceae bacterium]|nr:DNA cytosine methyltransferase [Muribaculaceae bacterium]